MRERAGFIIGISGVVLLLKPNFDPDQNGNVFQLSCGELLAGYSDYYRPAPG